MNAFLNCVCYKLKVWRESDSAKHSKSIPVKNVCSYRRSNFFTASPTKCRITCEASVVARELAVTF
jgi:hypothetical protein